MILKNSSSLYKITILIACILLVALLTVFVIGSVKKSDGATNTGKHASEKTLTEVAPNISKQNAKNIVFNWYTKNIYSADKYKIDDFIFTFHDIELVLCDEKCYVYRIWGEDNIDFPCAVGMNSGRLYWAADIGSDYWVALDGVQFLEYEKYEKEGVLLRDIIGEKNNDSKVKELPYCGAIKKNEELFYLPIEL